MVLKFKEHLNRLVPGVFTKKILLAVSGGIDSVTMCELFHKSGIDFGIAHCNFRLRGKQSESDALFVKNLSEKYKVPFYYQSFNTKNHAKENKLSVQMSARELRYKWLGEMKEKNHFDYFSTAHHKNDLAETFLLNLIRGTGIKGLMGIPEIKNGILRPLLIFTKEELKKFAVKEKLKWREDSSNQQTYYKRNFIRHNLIPLLEKINPSITETLYETIEKLRIPARLYEKELNRLKKLIKYPESFPFTIPFRFIQKNFSTPPLLWEFLSPYGFSYSQCKEIISSLTKQSGKQFYNESHRIIIDRNQLLMDCCNEKSVQDYIIKKNETGIHTPDFNLIFTEKKKGTFKINPSNRFAFLSVEKLKFPLLLRKWKAGDWFIPFGMKGRKKISDFLIDLKLSRIDKENTWVLSSNGAICWIVGYRIDERFKIDDTTQVIWVGKMRER
ncbi:MAG: tRNA lysidine(34) synthetase TilS [Bacteroidetes bacterium RIFCSPLOWO2_02_FULL_36_8]|nr:MAG: tRNA lysidine(34) synthetase TilS [Bacteroidetes bacterium RIFCSPLOWO2_02_FULL_36_8]OFY71202.1 MAG: tRNA lysidine(34) synthetase TilS [Bacteroidetes bacterium RIFCSPLOWO2_12_FULL_37_12]